jgi:hypothetical protein
MLVAIYAPTQLLLLQQAKVRPKAQTLLCAANLHLAHQTGIGTSALYTVRTYSISVSSRACRLLLLLLLPLLLLLLPPRHHDCTAATSSSLGASPQKRTRESVTSTRNAACHTCNTQS